MAHSSYNMKCLTEDIRLVIEALLTIVGQVVFRIILGKSLFDPQRQISDSQNEVRPNIRSTMLRRIQISTLKGLTSGITSSVLAIDVQHANPKINWYSLHYMTYPAK